MRGIRPLAIRLKPLPCRTWAICARSPEGVLATGPKLIIAEEGAGPPETIEVLAQADIPFVTVPDDYTAEGVSAKIRAVGQALGKGPQAEALAAELHQSWQKCPA